MSDIIAYNLFHKGILAFARAEQQGIRVDMEYAESKKQFLTRKIEYLENRFKSTKLYHHWLHVNKEKEPNIYSNTQLANFLYRHKGLKPVKTTESGQGATDEEALEALNLPELKELLQIRKLKKLRDTYLDAFLREQVDGYIHPFFNLHLVRTFRSSSDSPNFQNIPKRDKEAMEICRRALYPRPGHQLLEVDYSGIEVRIAACYHKDPTMLKYITDPQSDMHGDMAAQIFMIKDFNRCLPEHAYLRNAAKNGFVFPEFYGDYYKNCAENMACGWGQLPNGKWRPGQGVKLPEGNLSDHLINKGLISLDKFTDHIQEIESDFWRNRFRVYAKWKDSWWKKYQKNGYIELLTGFTCSGVMGRNDCINYPVQGAAFHCLLWAFIELDRVMREEQLDTRLIGQVHDSMILDVNPSELDRVCQTIKQVTCEDLRKAWDWIIVPMDVEMEVSPVDKSWAEKEKYDLL